MRSDVSCVWLDLLLPCIACAGMRASLTRAWSVLFFGWPRNGRTLPPVPLGCAVAEGA